MHPSAIEEQTSRHPSMCREYLERRSASVPRRKPLICGTSSLTYGDLFDRVPRIGLLLESMSIASGDRVIVLSTCDAATATLFFGLIAHGVTAVLLNPEASVDELEMLIEAADSAAIFADARIIAEKRLERVSGDATPIIGMSPEAPVSPMRQIFRRKNRPAEAENYPAILQQFDITSGRLPDVDEETIAYILFTSGTTSKPKGVQISHRSLFAQMQTFVRQYGLDEESRILNILPLHHTDGLTHGVVVSMVAGAVLQRPMRFSIDRLPELLDVLYKKQVSHFITVPSILTLIQQMGPDYRDAFQYPEFCFVISTAAYLDENLWDQFQRTFGVRVVNVYGLTETVCEACYCGPDDSSFKLGTVGKPVDCEARVFDADGNSLPAGSKGELALRGENIMAGYFRMPEETEAVFRGDWFLTGDLALIDDDGFVRIVGRKKSVIVTGGHNVYPEDVTNVLRSIDGVLDAVTFGLEDEIWGEKVVALVVPESGGELSVEYLAAELLKRASNEKLPRDIHIVEDLPRGPAGKVIIADARRIALELESHRTTDAGQDIEAVVFGLAAEIFKTPVEALALDSTSSNTDGWNSLAHVELLLAIEKVYRLKLEARDIMNIDSLQQAIAIIRQKQAS